MKMSHFIRSDDDDRASSVGDSSYDDGSGGLSFCEDSDDDDAKSRRSSEGTSSGDEDDFDDDESGLFGAGSSRRGDGDGNVGDDGTSPVEQFAQKETRLVQYSRCLIVILLIGSAALASWLTYYFLSKEEQSNFEQQYENDAQELIVRAQEAILENYDLVEYLTTLLTSTSQKVDSNGTYSSEFPLFTLTDFEKFGEQTLRLSGGLLVGYSPYVTENQRTDWEEYSVAHQDWIEQSFALLGGFDGEIKPITPYIFHLTSSDNVTFEPERDTDASGNGIYAPLWQMSPPDSDSVFTNINVLTVPTYRRLYDFVDYSGLTAMSENFNASEMGVSSSLEWHDADNVVSLTDPHPKSLVIAPIFERFIGNDSAIIGHVFAIVPWKIFIDDVLTEGYGIVVVMRQSCGGVYTYKITSGVVSLLGEGDLHDPTYDSMARSLDFPMFDYNDPRGAAIIAQMNATNATDYFCFINMTVYASQDVQNVYESNRPLYIMLGVLMVFSFTSLMFLLYDGLVQYRQSKLMAIATTTSSIVANLFPANVREQLFGPAARLTMVARKPRPPPILVSEKSPEQKETVEASNSSKISRKSKKKRKKSKKKMNSFLNDDKDELDLGSKPIADLFPNATVLFGDIAGFTAWSSVREPSQVFILLETIYRAFDNIAKQRRVFKVETIGDCYVAVVGLPDPCKDHALVMARFARDMLDKFNHLTHRLESTLGPDTGDLNVRIGCHSGPVTAGVLRGERARFQLFGDTVNTAARMESTGMRNRIQLSQETADLIISGGKANWVELREDLVHAKGKGELQTYWLKLKGEKNLNSSTVGDSTSNSEGADTLQDTATHVESAPKIQEAEMAVPKNEKVQRMVDWNADILIKLLMRVMSARAEAGLDNEPVSEEKLELLETTSSQIGNCMQDIVEVIQLPKFDEAAYDYDPEDSEIDENVFKQMRNYVALIASMYRPNYFHNFEHASHVTMSAVKLLSRIVAPSSEMMTDSEDEEMEHIDLHDYTYGITSDPLTQFAVVFSALIHDVDHKGVPNFLLCKEDSTVAAVYNNKSVAEQNSIDIAWGLLMDSNFRALRRAIYRTEEEMKRFRRLVVNSVIATDIFDKELSTLRRNRWEKAFNTEDSCSDTARCRKATIVIEHLIQASDVSHTMQHWHVYQKWNERLYREMYTAYLNERSEKDPTDGWYQGELNFFDGYIIPLAKKLKECGVFGVSGDEYLNYAEKNRVEWERKGNDIVSMMHKKYGRSKISADMLALAKLDEALLNFAANPSDKSKLDVKH